MTPLESALTVLRADLLIRPSVNDAQALIYHECQRMKEALEYYANTANYLDKSPMRRDERGNLTTVEDEGFMAQVTLRRIDWNGEVIVR